MKLCTKLVQWLTLAGVFFAVWTALVAEALPFKLSNAMHRVVLVVSSCMHPLRFLLQKYFLSFSFLCIYWCALG